MRSRSKSAWSVLRRSLKNFGAHDMATYAAALAYQVLFSLFPFLIFLVALLGFLQVPEFFDWLRQQAAALLPAQALEPVNTAIDQVQQPQGGLLSFGILLALWSASAGVRATMNALNVAYGVAEGRPMWKLYLLSLLYTVGLAALLITAAALMVLGPQVTGWLGDQFGLGAVTVTVWNVFRWPLAVALLFVTVALIYYVAPDVEQQLKFITPGSVLAVVVWIAASLGFAFYVQNFADYSATYGSVGAIIVLLFYFYLSAAILLFGAEVNAALEHHAPTGKDPGEKKQ